MKLRHLAFKIIFLFIPLSLAYYPLNQSGQNVKITSKINPRFQHPRGGPIISPIIPPINSLIISPITTLNSNRIESSSSSQLSSSSNKDSPTHDSQPPSPQSNLLPKLVLLSVPITWGTYTPVVKLLYNQPYPVPGIIFSTCYYAVAAVTLNAAKNIFISPTSSSPTSSSPTSSTTEGKEPSPLAGAELAGYLFVANILQVIGLQTTSAIVAAFIVQVR